LLGQVDEAVERHPRIDRIEEGAGVAGLDLFAAVLLLAFVEHEGEGCERVGAAGDAGVDVVAGGDVVEVFGRREVGVVVAPAFLTDADGGVAHDVGPLFDGREHRRGAGGMAQRFENPVDKPHSSSPPANQT
jgi:hypothetical protein